MTRHLPLTWLYLAALAGCTALPPAYLPPFPPPTVADIESIQPILPGNRWAIVDRVATWQHKSALHSALREGLAVPPEAASAIPVSGARVGLLTLTRGTQINYLIYEDFSGMTRVRLRYPSGTVISLEVPEEEEDDDEDC